MSEVLDKAIASEVLTSTEREELVKEMQSADWMDAEFRKAVADTVTKKLTEQVRKEDITQYYATIDRFKVGDTPEYTFQKGLKAYVHEVGTYAPRSHIIQRTLTVSTELVSVHPEMEISQLEAGRYGNMGSIRTMAAQELQGRKNAYLWNVLIASIAATDTNYGTFASTAALGVKKNVLVSGLDYVDDIAPGGVKAIVGRRSVLGFINELDGYAETTKTEIDNLARRTGGGLLLGTFRGIPVVGLHQYTDGLDVTRINASNIMIIANDTTRLAITEDLRMLQDVNVDDRTWHIHWSEKYGAFVLWPEYNFRIGVT